MFNFGQLPRPDSEIPCLYWRTEYPSLDIRSWLVQEEWIYCLYSYGLRDHLFYAACPQWYPTSPSPDPPIHLGDLLKLAVTVVLLVCLNILWLKTIAWGGKADGMCLGSVSGMQKLAGTFTSHNISRAKGTYQNWDLHRTHRHPSPKLWSCSAAPILLNSISIFQFKVFQIHWVTPQFMHSPAQVLADGNKSVSILQHWWGVIKHHWTLAYVSFVSTEMFQMERLRLFTM